MIDAPPSIRIQHDLGGRLGDYIERRARWLAGEIRVEIKGECFSACTIYSSLPRACVGPNAVLGFHAPQVLSSPETGPKFFGDVMLSYYPARLQRWIEKQGGLTHEVIYLSGKELQEILPSCLTKGTPK